MIKTQPDGLFVDKNDMTVKKTDYEKKMEKIIREHEHVFKGIRLIRDKKNNRDIYGSFKINEDVQPDAQQARRVPFHIEQPLKKWLEQGVKEDIFEPVPKNAPIKWCSTLVVQPKPRFESTPKSKLERHMTSPHLWMTSCKSFEIAT